MYKATVQIYSGKKLAKIREQFPLLTHVPIPSANSFMEIGEIAVAYANKIGLKDELGRKNLLAHSIRNIEFDESEGIYTVTLDVTDY